MPSVPANRKYHFVHCLSCLVLCTLFYFLLVSCEQRPAGILSKSEMEEVLYDYHLTQAMTDWTDESENTSHQAMLEAVFEKHGTTQAEFDSSLVWYNAHASDLKDIYENLRDRFTFENQKLQLAVGENQLSAVVSENGDTTNLWNGPALLLLRNSQLLNMEKFTIKGDSLFQRGDHFVFSGEVIVLCEERFNRDLQFIAALSVGMKDGSRLGDSYPMNNSGRFNIDLRTSNRQTPSQLSCFFQYQSSDDIRNFCIVRNLSLIRMHTHPAEVDSLDREAGEADAADSVAVQPVNSKPVRKPRLTPEQLRIQSQDDVQKIEIRTAPERRTPNSFGPTRRKKQ